MRHASRADDLKTDEFASLIGFNHGMRIALPAPGAPIMIFSLLFGIQLVLSLEVLGFEDQPVGSELQFFGSKVCKLQYGFGEADEIGGAVASHRWRDAEALAKRNAQEKACKAAGEKAKTKIHGCPKGCYPRFFVREKCDYEDLRFETGEGESDWWFMACRLDTKPSNNPERPDFCASYKDYYPQWAIHSTKANAMVSLWCLKD